jgi:hypothetical protein
MKCQKMKKFHFVCKNFIKPNKTKIFTIFGKFRNLENLRIEFSGQDFIDVGNIKSFKNCKSLKKLQLLELYLNDENLKDIDLYLPQLKLLNIGYISKGVINDSTLISIAKIPNLRYLYLNSKLTVLLNCVSFT